MPEIGEIRYGREIGLKTWKLIWHACEVCGKQRWVTYVAKSGKAKDARCHLCIPPTKGHSKIPISKDSIIELYYGENLTIKEVGEKLGVCLDVIRHRMKEYDITAKDAHNYCAGPKAETETRFELIRKLYCEDMLSFNTITKQTGMVFTTAKRLLLSHGIQLRSISETIKNAYKVNKGMGFRNGKRHHRFNGYRQKKTSNNGYIRVFCPENHRAGKNGYVFEHILVWEEAHKQELPEGWLIHHLNGIKDDNRPENLFAMSTQSHRFVITNLKKKIKSLEIRNKELEKSLSEAIKMNLS